MLKEEDIKGLSKEEYGDSYRAHVLDLYKMYVASADKISDRRQTANTFFVSLNSTIIGLVGYLNLSQDTKTSGVYMFALVAMAGMLICYMWYSLIRSYKNMNSGKFQVINAIERMLPLRPYDAEWIALEHGKNPKRYLEFSRVEANIPLIFFLLHMIVFVRSIL